MPQKRGRVLAAAIVAFLPALLLWEFGFFLPRWVRWTKKEIAPVANAFEANEGYLHTVGRALPKDEPDAPDRILLANGRFTIEENGETVYTSPFAWRVQDVFFEDVDYDGAGEIVAVCWKRGSYGPVRPSWVKRDTHRFTQHIYIFDWTLDGVRQLWMSSALDMTVRSAWMDGATLYLTDKSGLETAWRWGSWGIERDFEKEHARVSFLAVGDNLLHEGFLREGLARGNDFSFLYEAYADEIAGADLAAIGQETMLVTDEKALGGYPLFGSPASLGEAIVGAGFDIVCCANNHALDKGAHGIETTIDFYAAQEDVVCLGITKSETVDAATRKGVSTETEMPDAAKAPDAGARENATPETPNAAETITPEILTGAAVVVKNGVRFALLNYTYGVNGLPDADKDHMPPYVRTLIDKDAVIADLRAAREIADVVVVFAHWGEEYAAEPDETQRAWADIFFNEGVDVVIGAHPHTLQPLEIREEAGRQTLIYYSLGNFVSAPDPLHDISGGVARFTVVKDNGATKIIDATLTPLP